MKEPSADPASARTLPELVRAAAARYGDDPAVRLAAETIPSETISYRQLDERSALIARGLIARGVGKGARVGFLFGNGPGFALMLAAIARIGAVAVPVSTLIKAGELVRVLRQSDIGGLIVQRRLLGKDYVERLTEALPDLREGGPALRIAATPYLRWIVSGGEGLPASVGEFGALERDAQSVSEAHLRAIEAEVHPTDQMIEIYTSGAMALPKGVKHSHGPVLARTHYLRRMLAPERHQEVRAIMPMFWIGGLMMYLLPSLAAGAVVACTEGTSTSSRMAMGSVLADEDMKAMPKMSVIWALGMTETIGPYSYADEMRAPGYPLCAPLDHIAEGYEVRLVDDQGRPVDAGERGEIQVRGPAVTPGIHKLERSAVFTPDGFYRTGDLGVMEGGRILFVGRSGDMIKTSSSNVSPAEVEYELQQLEGVHSAYVVGLPDRERGQIVVAALVPREGCELDFTRIERQMRERLSSFKVPRAYVVMTREEVPMLFSNKVGRRAVERFVAERLQRSLEPS